MENKTIFENISELKENLQQYLETKLSYYGITAFEKAVKILTAVAAQGFVGMLMLIALIFLSAAAAIYIGTLLESTELGLLIVGGFYLLLGLIFYLFRRKIFSSIIIKILVNIFFQDDEDVK
ncbi:MAG: phage holin family protein [Bacteroidales bacterium]